MYDSNGNYLTVSSSSGTTTFTDTLGNTALTVTGSGTPSSPLVYTYTNPQGGTSSFTVNYQQYTVQTNFGCSGVVDYGAQTQYLVSSVSLPDGTSYAFSYEPTPGYPSNVTGRLASVRLPVGGTITYAYSGGNNGIICGDGSTATLTRTTPDSTTPWTYAHTESGTAWTTTVTDPASNQTVIDFSDAYETERNVHQGSSTLLSTVDTCYNGAALPCIDTTVSLPITERVVRTKLASGSSNVQSQATTFYDSFGFPTEVDEDDYGSGAVGPLVRKTVTAYSTFNNPSGTLSFERPSSVTISNGGGTTVAKTTYAYSNTVVATSGTPQHTAPSGDRANLTSVTYTTQGSSTLGKSFTYYDTGLVDQPTDVNGAQTSYPIADWTCGNALPTQVDLPASLYQYMTWNCTGGALTSVYDGNSAPTKYTYTYSDPNFWRPTAVEDPSSATTNISYTASPSSLESTLDFNGTTSTADVYTQLDHLGRLYLRQRKQSQTSTNYDSVETAYDALGRPSEVSVPYSAAKGGAYKGSSFTTTTYDALGRVTQVTDAGGGTASYSYTLNDVFVTIGPAPGGENTKRRQLEYDALGRLTSVCEVTGGTGSGTCAQSSSVTGYWTKYTYDALGDLTGVTQNAQSSSTQTRTYTYDGLGRLLSEKNPETNQVAYSYVYDTDSTCGTYDGDLVKRVDAVGNVTCYQYDGLHRVTKIYVSSGSYKSSTPDKYYVYDAATVNGVSMANAKGRLADAYTTPSGQTTKLTDLGFSYSARGEVKDAYQSSPHSNGYYHTSASYWANGVLNTLSGPGLPTFTYTPDGEGRADTVGAGSGQNPVTGTSYNVFSEATAVNFGSGDSDSFSYDANTGRMTQYKYNVGSSSLTGNLTWNANGSLKTLAITDPFNSSDTQTCNYGYDDLARIGSVSCDHWTQTFSFDAFGNIDKTGSNGGISFLPSYSSSTNRVTSVGGQAYTYDANGNLLGTGSGAGSAAYSWDAEGNLLSETVYGQLAHLRTYDALGRMVETSSDDGSSYLQFVYGVGGDKEVLMQGQSFGQGRVPLPAGAVAYYGAGSALTAYWQADWQQSVRFASTPGRAMWSDSAFAPYGEQYASSGVNWADFAGTQQNLTLGTYDADFRRYIAVQGRWLSPDPAGLAAVDPASPQSLNRYAYVRNNPTTLTDATGLCAPGSPNCKQLPSCYGMVCADQYYGGSMYPGFTSADQSTCTVDGVSAKCGEINWDTVVQCPGNYCGIVTMSNGSGQIAFGEFHPTQTDPYNYQQLTPWTYGGLTDEQLREAYWNQLGGTVGALSAAGANPNAVDAFINDNPFSTSSQLVGGNFDFQGASLFSDLECPMSRCDLGALGTLDFSHNDGTFHLDTADPFSSPWGTLVHFGVDVILGNLWYAVIPRPWH